MSMVDDDDIQKKANELLELHLYDSNITSLRDVRDLHLFINLQVLNLHSNHITQIENLSTLVNLRELNLSSNDIARIEGLQRLAHLEILNLSSNRIKEVAGLDGMGSLRRLNLSFNLITNLAGFTALNGPHSRLQHVDLRGNRVSDLEDLLSLSRCQNLRFLALQMEPRNQARSNPVCSQKGYRAHLFKHISTLFCLDGYDINMKPIHESDDQDVQNFPSLAPYVDFLPEHGVRRPVSAHPVDTPHIDQVLQRVNSRRSSTASQKQDQEPPDKEGDKNNRFAKLDHLKNKGTARDRRDNPPPKPDDDDRQIYKPKSNHEERLAKLEAQLAKRLSARREARTNRNIRSFDSESSVSIDEDLSSTVEEASVNSSINREELRRHDRARYEQARQRKDNDEDQRKDPIIPKISKHVQTEAVDDDEDGDKPTIKSLYEEIGLLQKEIGDRDAVLQQVRTREKRQMEATRELEVSLQQANVREHGLRDALAHEKDATLRQTQQINSLLRQVEELGEQLRRSRENESAAEDQRQTLQSALESMRAVCDTEKSHGRQKDVQLERLTALLRERQGEEMNLKGKEGELHLELQRAQAQLAVYQREADDIRELKRELQVQKELVTGFKEEKMKLQNILQNHQSAVKSESAKLRELQKAYEELSHSHAELKQVARAAVHKEGQMSELVEEMTLLVKKMKAKEQKAIRNLNYVEEERDILIEKLNRLRYGDEYDPAIIDKERQAMKRELNQLLNERDSLHEQISTLQAQLSNRPPLTEIQDLKLELEQKTDALRVKDKMLDDQNDSIHQLKALIKEKEQELSRAHKLEDELNGLYDQLEDSKHKEKQLQQDLEKKDRSLREMEKSLTELEEECDSLQASGKKKSKHIQELEQRYSMVENTIRQLREESERLCEEEAIRAGIITQQLNEATLQNEALERENTGLQVKLQQATDDAAALVVLADKMRRKDKAARARGAKARTQLDQLHRIMSSIVKQDLFLPGNDEDGDVSEEIT